MGIFSRTPSVKEISLKKEYKFMYENFVISSQRELYLLLARNNDIVDALKFEFKIYKFGYPNDEALGAHPMAKFGLGFYGFFEVKNSPWIDELRNLNRAAHERHTDSMYSNYRHYIARFKDVTLDVISRPFEEVQLTSDDIFKLVKQQLDYLKVD